MGKRPRSNKVENMMAKALDDLSAFEAFQEEVLPILRKAIKEGWSADKIEKHPKVMALMAARKVTIALTDLDTGRALTAISDTQNRREGKPVERKELKATIESLPDDALDARLNALLADEDDESASH